MNETNLEQKQAKLDLIKELQTVLETGATSITCQARQVNRRVALCYFQNSTNPIIHEFFSLGLWPYTRYLSESEEELKERIRKVKKVFAMIESLLDGIPGVIMEKDEKGS